MDQMTSENQESQDTDDTTSPLKSLLQSNIAKSLTDEQLQKIGQEALEGFELDIDSRSSWEAALQEWMKLAMQAREAKSFPWNNASNVKFPLLSTAAMQFSARAYPSLVPSNGKVVKTRVIGKDPTGEKFDLADRVSSYMSWQVMYDMEDWEEDMDRMLLTLPIAGTIFKKTFYSSAKDKICSKLVMPLDLVVNNSAKSLETAERITEIIELSPRLVEERKRQGVFLDIDLGEPQARDATVDKTTPHIFLEQHTYLDLDDDDYPEPYIVTLHKDTGKVVRIAPRYDEDSLVLQNDKLVQIKPIHYYTKFSFVPNPDGSFYDIGFGMLLGPINESINTLINQLIDAGTLSNMQGGFIGKGLKLRTGEHRFTPGEWKPVASTGDDIKKQIVPLPAKEPSQVLFTLMGSLITSGKELASVAEIFVGKMPGQNTPATTTMAAVEQGMKVFTAVYKRMYRSLDKEFKKIFWLNQKYTDPNTYVSVVDVEIGPEDFDPKKYDICPGADPSAVSQSDKLMKAQALLEMLPLGEAMMDPIEVFRRVFEAQEQPNPEKLFNQQIQQSGQLSPPAPDPKLLAIEAKSKIDQQKAALDAAQKQQDMELSGRDKELQLQMKQQSHAQKMQHTAEQAQLKAASGIQMSNIFAATARQKAMTDVATTQAVGEAKVQQAKELAKSKPSRTSNSKSGKATK